MAEPPEDRESVDRAFAAMVAGYHLTAERPEPSSLDRAEPGPAGRGLERAWADEHSSYPPAEAAPRPAPEPDTAYVPEPLPPLPRPGWVVLLSWIGIGVAALVVLAAGFGVPLPAWIGWLAIAAFVSGFGALLTRLPRHRPPDAGDGAVL